MSGPVMMEAVPRVGDAGLASEQVQVISSSAESCSGNEFKEQERAKWLKYVVAEGKGDKQRGRQDLGQAGRGLHTLGESLGGANQGCG